MKNTDTQATLATRQRRRQTKTKQNKKQNKNTAQR